MFLIKHFVASAIHLGHKTNQWNPRTAFFLFAASKGTKIHIIDLEQTILMIRRALTFIQKIAQRDGFLLVSLRDLPLSYLGSPQEPDLSPLLPPAAPSEVRGQSACKVAQSPPLPFGLRRLFFSTSSSPFPSPSRSLRPARSETVGSKRIDSGSWTPDHKLGRGSAAEMCPENGAPPRGAIFLFQAGKNAGPVLIKEAMKWGLPVVALVNSNSNPTGIQYPIPGNDDSVESINLYIKLLARAVPQQRVQDLPGKSKETHNVSFRYIK